MSTAALEQQFELHGAQLPGSAGLTRVRRDALAAFTAKGFPTRRDEAWHYTDLKPVAQAGFDFAPPAPNADARASARALLETLSATPAVPAFAGTPVEPRELGAFELRAVLVDGRFDETLSSLEARPGLEVTSLAADWTLSEGVLAKRGFEDHALANLNTAFARDGLLIRAARGAAVTEPLHVVLAGSGRSGIAEQPRVVIDLGPSSALTVVVHLLDAGDPAKWLNIVTQISQAEGSRLSMYRLQRHAPNVFHTSLVSAAVEKDAALEIGYVDLGGKIVRNDVDVRLAGSGASVSAFGMFFARSGQHIDEHLHVSHDAPHTVSDQVFRGIADRNGRGVFNGKVVVQPGAQCIDARQSSDNLLLADQAEIDTKPELEIYADDVKCSHGATVGELDEQHLFYLRSRGIDEAAARSLLTFAFANTVLRRLKPDSLRDLATAEVAGHLPEAGHVEDAP